MKLKLSQVNYITYIFIHSGKGFMSMAKNKRYPDPLRSGNKNSGFGLWFIGLICKSCTLCWWRRGCGETQHIIIAVWFRFMLNTTWLRIKAKPAINKNLWSLFKVHIYRPCQACMLCFWKGKGRRDTSRRQKRRFPPCPPACSLPWCLKMLCRNNNFLIRVPFTRKTFF